MNTETKIKVGAASILLLVVGVATASFWTIRNLTRAYAKVNHTNQVLDEINALPSYIKDAISGARGYYITGNNSYLQTYSAAVIQIEPHVNILHDLTEDNPDQRERTDELGRLLEEELAIQKQIIAERAAGEAGPNAISLLDSGKLTMEKIRSLSARMKATETLQLNQRIAAAEQHAGEVVDSILVMSVLAMLFVLMSYYVAQHDRRARETSAKAIGESEEKIRLILNSIAEGIYTIDMQGKCIACNPACLRMLGYEDEHQLTGKNMHELAHHTRPDGSPLPAEECRIFRALQEGHGFHTEDEVFWRSDGSSFPVEYWSYPIRRDGATTGAVVTLLDITRRKKAEADSRQANDMLANLVRSLERSGGEVTLLSQMGSMLQSCLTLEEAYQVIERSARGLFPEESGAVFAIAPSRDVVEAIASWGNALSGEKTFASDDCWALRSGRPHQLDRESLSMVCRHVGQLEGISYLCIPMMAQGEAIGILHLQSPVSGEGAMREMHFKRSKVQLATTVAEHIGLALANLRLRDVLRAQSIRDALTGLLNRRFMEESLEKELKRADRNSRPVTVILLDVDHFKRYNDTHGHEAGDAILRELGGYLKSQIRGEDIACRYGGEEFILIMPDATLESASQRAEKLRQGVKRIQIKSHGQPLDAISISLGVAVFPANGKVPDALLRSADSALYEAKESGRDRVVIAKPALEETSEAL